MSQTDTKDFLGGLLVTLFGIGVAAYAYFTLPLGSVSRMGPGMFPVALGILITVFGVLILAAARARSGTLPAVEWRPAVMISLGMIGFALTVDRFGAVPAVSLLVIAASFATRRPNPWLILILCATLSVTGIAIFSWGFNLPIEPLRWRP